MPDHFHDELVMVISSAKGLIIITGCSHSGIRNILKKVKSVFPGQKIGALVGGLHLSRKSILEVKLSANFLIDQGISQVAACHCTGDELARHLLPEQVVEFRTGDELVI